MPTSIQYRKFRCIQILVLIFSLSFLSACGDKDKNTAQVVAPVDIKVAQVTRKDVPIYMEFIGQTKGSIDAEIRARVEGVLQGMHFEEGSEVQEGQLLYSIDPAPLQAKLAEAKGKLAEAATLLVKAESDLKRVRPLVEMKALSERDLDSAVAQEGAARGGVEAAKANVEVAEIELSYTKIMAPTKGLIGLSKAKVGEFVGRSPNPIVLNTVSNLDPIHARFSVTEKDYLRFARVKREDLEAGKPPKQTEIELFLADDSKYPNLGEIASADREIDAKTGTLTVEAKFPNPTKLIRPGQFARVRGIVETVNGAMLIPKRAVQELQGQYQVFVVKDDNSVEARTVKLGALVDDSQIIESGLNEQDKIALDGLQRLKSGMVINPILEKANG